MRKVNITHRSKLKVDESFEGEPIEFKMQRIMQERVPIEQMSPEIFTARKDGVLPQYDIRTDRFEIAEKAMDAVSQARIARREEKLKSQEEAKIRDINDGGKTDAAV